MFTIDRGTTQSFTIQVLDGDDVPVSLDGARIYFTVRVNDVVVFAKANTAGGGGDAQIETIDSNAGKFRVKFTNADSSIPPVIGTCDGFVVTALGEHLKPIKNQPFQITQSMTRAFPT